MKGKLQSRRFWLALWAAALCTAIVAIPRPDFSGLATLLAGIVAGYIGAESYLKKALPKE